MIKDSNSSLLKGITVAAFLIMITVNALANILPLGGVGTGEVSEAYPNLFAPAAITFAIWGVIYILLAMFTLYQAGIFNKNEDPEKQNLIRKVSKIFIATSLVNAAWIFAWHYKMISLSLILMVVLLGLLAVIMLSMKRHSFMGIEELFVKLPFSIYFGWITVAAIANITIFFVSMNWGGLGLPDVFWAVAVLAVGAAIGIIAILSFKDFFYGLVLIWAYAGILLKHLSANGFEGDYTSVIITVCFCLVLFAAAEVAVIFLHTTKKNSNLHKPYKHFTEN